jgi:hypothetical protein
MSDDLGQAMGVRFLFGRPPLYRIRAKQNCAVIGSSPEIQSLGSFSALEFGAGSILDALRRRSIAALRFLLVITLLPAEPFMDSSIR